MSIISQFLKKHTQLKETEHALELDMTGMLGIVDGEFKTTIINMLRILTDKVDSMLEQMSKVSREKF